jgi:sodium-dependent dicarboxylate transporter 2/3/5
MTTHRFDGRPLSLLLLARHWRQGVLLAVLAALALAWRDSAALPLHAASGELSAPMLRALAIFAAAVALWVTSPVPLVVTSFGIFAALALGDLSPGIATSEQGRQVAGWFADPIVFFLLGAFLIAGSLSSAHVVDHLALRLLNLMGTSARRLRQVLFWSAFGAAFLMSEHAVTAMLFPLAVRIRDALARPRGSSKYLQGLFIGVAWGATIGGIVTYLGGSRNPLAMGFLQRQEVAIPGFFRLMAFSLPVAVPLALVAACLLEWAFPVDIASIAEARQALAERRRELGRFGPRQCLVTLVLAGAVAGWMAAGYEYIAVVAVGAAALLLGLRLVSWTELQREVPWDLLLLYASALALAKALSATGAPALIGRHLLPVLPHSPAVTIACIATIAMLLTEAVSHGAVVSMLVPLLVAAAPSLHLDPLVVALAVALPTGLAFMLPMGSPPLAIAFASGEFRLGTMGGWGAILNILAVPVVVLAYLLVWRHLL